MDQEHEVIISPRAAKSLEKILTYLVENASVTTAEKVREKLIASIHQLGKMPTSNPVVRGIVSKKNIVYRRILSMSYRIVYTIKEEKLQVLVVEIHHTKRNPSVIIKSFE